MNNTWESDKDDGQAIESPTMETHPPDENQYKHDLIFRLYRSTRPLLSHSTSFKCLPDDLMCRLKKPEESFEYPLESIRALLNSWKMGAASDNPLRCENPRLFNASAKSVLHTSQGDSADIRKKDEVANECVAKGPSQWRGNDQFVGETAQVTRCMDLELDEAAPRPLI